MSSLIFSNEGFGIWTISFQVVVPQLKGETEMLDISEYLESKKIGDVNVLTLSSPDISDEKYVKNLRAIIIAMIEHAPAPRFVISFNRVDFLSSSALAILVVAQKRAEECGTKIKLSNIKPHLRDFFRITRFDTLFDIHETEDQAVAAFGSS